MNAKLIILLGVLYMPIHRTSDGRIVVGRGLKIERVRRICGYLVGTTDRWNDAKRVELSERVKHTSQCNY